MNLSHKNHPLTPIDEALEKLLIDLPRTEGTELVTLADACGRVLTERLVASINVPSHANSAMDGYAVCTKDLAFEPTKLKVVQRIAAGQVGKRLSKGEAARIFTGASIPEGANAVVMQENCSLVGDEVEILQMVETGENVREVGEDIQVGEVLLHAGHRLRPQDIGLAASIGLTKLSVQRNLTVAVITTGNELVLPGNELKGGQIYNSNFFTLSTLLRLLNVEVIELGIVEDDLVTTTQTLEEAARVADCIISTGGVSVGEEDYVKAAVELVGSLDLWKLAIKPGKPFASGKVHNTQFFGLPGNPVSTFVTFVLLVRPCLLAMLGCKSPMATLFQAQAAFDSDKSGERQQYLRVNLGKDGKGRPELKSCDNQSSGAGSSLCRADGLAIIPPYTSVARGDTLEFIPFSELLT